MSSSKNVDSGETNDSEYEEQGPDREEMTFEKQVLHTEMLVNRGTSQNMDDNKAEPIINHEQKDKSKGLWETDQEHSEDNKDEAINNENTNDYKNEDDTAKYHFQAAIYESKPKPGSQKRLMEEKSESRNSIRSKEKNSSLSRKKKDENRVNGVQKEPVTEMANRERIAVVRRSEEASLLMVQGNPNISDLSDTNRPTKLAERFSELYSNEHTDALEELQALNIDEKTSVSILLNIIKGAYGFCSEKVNAERKFLLENLQADPNIKIENIKKAHAAKQLKVKATELSREVCEDFLKNKFPNIITEASSKGTTRKLDIFAKECVSIIWLMCVQDPQIVMEWVDDDNGIHFDTEKYRGYTKTGTMIDFCVWPVVYLCKEGSLLSKGIAQGI
ncbi:hypothetical protein CHS0354_026419 [Potamilus streckersoni]|uniref:Mitochondria-eating protein n=1 Tax=Potamilus streckersoni TaxID=2493646 RepID=A0AAE0T328_9BIVA|nr:hypothetical protein CHS0354_026419 [Potamilus streckersoni]